MGKKAHRIAPIAEANGFVVGCTSRGDDYRNNHQAQEAQDLDGSCDDLSFTKEANIHQVNRQDRSKTDCDDYCRGDVCPVRYHDCCSRNL